VLILKDIIFYHYSQGGGYKKCDLNQFLRVPSLFFLYVKLRTIYIGFTFFELFSN